jgi:hypothetical protein
MTPDRHVLTESVEKSSTGKKLNIQYISCDQASNHSNNTDTNNGNNQQQPAVTQPSIIPADNYSYVQLTAVNDYPYSSVDDPLSSMLRRSDSTCSLKKRAPLDVHESIVKESALIKARLRCR